MKSNKLTCPIVLALCTTGAIPVRLAAQGQQQEQKNGLEQRKEPDRYKFFDLGTFGGPVSSITEFEQWLRGMRSPL
jgi:hypothetical protein